MQYSNSGWKLENALYVVMACEEKIKRVPGNPSDPAFRLTGNFSVNFLSYRDVQSISTIEN